MADEVEVNDSWVSFRMFKIYDIVADLKHDQQAVYFMLYLKGCMGETIPRDCKLAAKRLGYDARMYRRVIGELIERRAVCHDEHSVWVRQAVESKIEARDNLVQFRRRARG